jgi:hypothetical protein
MIETRIITSQFDLRALNVTELTELKIGEIRCTQLDRSSQTQSDLSHKFGSAFKMISRRMKNIQHTKLETHGGSRGEAQVDPSVMPKMLAGISNFSPFLSASQCLSPEGQSQQNLRTCKD